MYRFSKIFYSINVRVKFDSVLHIRVYFSILELCHGRNYKSRLEFLDICQNIMEFFSKSFFKEYFFDEVLVLGKVITIISCFILYIHRRAVKCLIFKDC